jgi:(p)ppGpp synthase/HD superfamily hydrolase
MIEIIELSKTFSKDKHSGLKRKNDEPYYHHCLRVGDLVSKLTKDSDVISAAYLHDVLEHSNTTEKELSEVFNEKVVDLVKELTNDIELIKIKGKTNYLIEKINNMSEDCLLIKLCDRYDNLIDVGSKPTYSVETLKLIKNMDRKLNSSHKKMIELIKSIIVN